MPLGLRLATGGVLTGNNEDYGTRIEVASTAKPKPVPKVVASLADFRSLTGAVLVYKVYAKVGDHLMSFPAWKSLLEAVPADPSLPAGDLIKSTIPAVDLETLATAARYIGGSLRPEALPERTGAARVAINLDGGATTEALIMAYCRF